jgi:hypothetical protein
MAVVKTERLVRWFEWNVKTIIYVAVHDRPVGEAIIVGPVRYFTRRVLVITHSDLSDLSEGEVERLVARVVNSELRCRKCRYRGGYPPSEYIRVDIKNGRPDLKTAVCNNCEPTVGCTLAPYEAFDVAFVETRGN